MMSHIGLKQLQITDERRPHVFWFPRTGLETKNTPFGMKLSVAAREIMNTLDALRRDDEKLSRHIDDALAAINAAAALLRELKAMEEERNKKSFPIPLVRYGLVTANTGRDAGVGRLANRWIECALDACRYTAKFQDEIVTDTLLGVILNTSTGVETYASLYGPAPLRDDRIKMECEMVRELLMEVDRSEVEEVAKRFRKALKKRDLNGITNWFADDINDYLNNHQEHFRDLSGRDRRYLPLADFRTVLKKKLNRLFLRLGDNLTQAVGGPQSKPRQRVAKKRRSGR
jgi:hypothetical protein